MCVKSAVLRCFIIVAAAMMVVSCSGDLPGRRKPPADQRQQDEQADEQSGDGDKVFYARPVSPDRLPADTLAAVRRRGELRVAVAESLGGAMRDKNGELIGFEIDLLRRLADDLGVSVRFYPVPWPDLTEPLLEGRVDLVAGGLGVTPQRALIVTFTDPYRSGGVVLAAHRRHQTRAKKPLKGYFDRPEIVIGVMSGNVTSALAAAHFPKAVKRNFDDQASLFEELRAGKIDAALSYSSRAEIEALRSSEAVYLPQMKPLASWPQAYGVRQGDHNFLHFLNAWILAHKHDGWIKEKHDYWYKTLSWSELL